MPPYALWDTLWLRLGSNAECQWALRFGNKVSYQYDEQGLALLQQAVNVRKESPVPALSLGLLDGSPLVVVGHSRSWFGPASCERVGHTVLLLSCAHLAVIEVISVRSRHCSPETTLTRWVLRKLPASTSLWMDFLWQNRFGSAWAHI